MSKKFMWMRCPGCGRWCYAEKQDAWGRLKRVFSKEEDVSEVIAEIGDSPFINKGLARLYGKFCNTVKGTFAAPGEAFGGDNYKFYCTCGHKWGTDDETKSQSEGHKLVCEYQELEKSYDSSASMSKTQLDTYVNRISTLLTRIQGYNYMDDYQSSLYDLYSAVQYFRLHNSSKAFDAIQQSLKLFPNDANSLALRGVYRKDIQKPYDRYTKLQDIIKYKDAEIESPYMTSGEFQTELDNAVTNYVNEFLNIPKERRKYLVVDDELRMLPNSFMVLTPDMLSRLDEAGLEFPNGYASEKCLYVCHPYKTYKYLDAENYKDQLFFDQLDELKNVLHCLGAKQIDMTDMITHETTIKSDKNADATVGGAKGGVSANVEGSYSRDSNSYKIIKNQYFCHQDFPCNPDIKPYVWDGSAWYNHVAEWKSLAQMRLREGSRSTTPLTGTIVISSFEEKIIKENEQLRLKADFDAMLAKGNVKGGYSLSFEKQESRNHKWKISVEFYPMSNYNNAPIVNLETKQLIETTPVVDIQSDNTSTNPKKWNRIWLLGFIIAILLAVIVCLLIF